MRNELKRRLVIAESRKPLDAHALASALVNWILDHLRQPAAPEASRTSELSSPDGEAGL